MGPSTSPTETPTDSTDAPTHSPTPGPTNSEAPTVSPTTDPTLEPTVNPTTAIPSLQPTLDPIVPIIDVNDGGDDDNLGVSDGNKNDDAAPAQAAKDGIIPGTNSTISYVMIGALLLLLLGCVMLGIAYKFDRKRKQRKMRDIERNISSGYGNNNGVMMVGASSPSGDGNLTLPSWDRPKQPSVLFVCADEEMKPKKKRRSKKKMKDGMENVLESPTSPMSAESPTNDDLLGAPSTPKRWLLNLKREDEKK